MANERDRIREQKKQQLMNELQGEGPPTQSSTDSQPSPSEPIHIESPEHLTEVTNTYDVVLADFYADWCGPCKMIEPIVADIAQSTPAAVAKIDIDQLQRIAQQQGVRGVPTLFLYVDGEPVERMVGAKDRGTLMNLVDQYT